jgi:branched-chain amino acid transport system ATP-binding protein
VTALVELDAVSFAIGGQFLLRDVTLGFRAGEVTAIVGPNGAGKSTLLNVCVGRLRPDTGAVVFDGQILTGKTPYQINQLGVSRVFQTPEIFPDLTVHENVVIPALAKRDGAFALDAWWSMAHEKDLRGHAEAAVVDVGLGDKLRHEAGSLSRGDKRRLELAMCLVQNPRLLLLDEPTAGMSRLDTNRTIDLLKRIKERGMTKVIIEHDMHVVFSLADRVTVMAQGRIIAEGTPDEVRGDPLVQEAYLGGGHA